MRQSQASRCHLLSHIWGRQGGQPVNLEEADQPLELVVGRCPADVQSEGDYLPSGIDAGGSEPTASRAVTICFTARSRMISTNPVKPCTSSILRGCQQPPMASMGVMMPSPVPLETVHKDMPASPPECPSYCCDNDSAAREGNGQR